MPALTIGVLRETARDERRVAVTPNAVTRLRALGLEVIVESGADAGAWFLAKNARRPGHGRRST